MKKIVSLILALTLMCGAMFSLASCGGNKNAIAVQEATTSLYYITGNEDFPGIDGYEAKIYDTFILAATDLQNGAVPYMIVDNKTGESLVNNISGIKMIEVPLAKEEYGIAVDKNNAKLLEDINAALAELKSSGKLAEILEMEEADFTPVSAGEFDENKKDTQLVVATNAEFPPFESKDGDKFIGIDIEIAKYVADKLGMELVIQDMKFEAVVTSVGVGGVDIGMSGLTINDERKKTVNFSTPYFESYLALVVTEDNNDFADCKTEADMLKVLADKIK